MFEENPISLMFKEELFYELAFQGWVSIDFEKGTIFNNRTSNLMGYQHNSGYIALAWKYRGKVYHILAHRLIWMLANGPIPVGLEINHKDGDKTNNKLKNLELVTPSENMQHAFKTGLVNIEKLRTNLRSYFRKNRHVNCKLTADNVRKILKLRKQDPKKFTMRKLAEMFNISHSNIVRLINQETYVYLNDKN